MSEVERRRSYWYNAILIDSDRVLTPQFDDAVIYVTGAQLELLRNVTQYLNRRNTYAAESHDGYYLVPDDADYDEILAIVADLEETLMGNPNTIWGYADRWSVFRQATSTGSYHTYCSTVAVPAGYVYVLEHWEIYHLGDQDCGMTLGMGATGTVPIIYDAPAVPSGDYIYQPANMTMKEDDVLTLDVISLPDTKGSRLRVWGHMMIVPED